MDGEGQSNGVQAAFSAIFSLVHHFLAFLHQVFFQVFL
jgi:hypothetical protein